MEHASTPNQLKLHTPTTQRSVVARFEYIAEQHPDRIALVWMDHRLTYRQLNERANQVAHKLIQLGLELEEPVAIAIPKSIDLIISVLGILKAGGAYVPMVDNQPIARLQCMLDDVACRFMMTQDGYLDQLTRPGLVQVQVDDCQDCESSNPDQPIREHNLAYILYTSGSTGTPKGVMIEHSGIIRLVCDQSYLPFGPDFHYLFLAPMSFDVSTQEIYTPLLHGAKLVIVPEGEPDPHQIRDLCHREQVQSACIAFGYFASLFESCPQIFEYMQIVAVGGEQVQVQTVVQAQRRYPHIQFINAYGPTEATMLATTYEIPASIDSGAQHIPIGKALNRVQTHILDDQLKPVIQGEPGELCLSGVGIARGYLNQPELSADRFVTNPFGGSDSPRMYRTGDLVKQDEQDDIIFLGRIDHQVKVRGVRIELGEIESVAMSIGSVQSACAAQYGPVESKSIGLFIVANLLEDSSLINTQTIRTHITDQLPASMVPDSIVIVDSIPLNPNGKQDRKALTRFFEDQSCLTQSSESDSQLDTPTQHILAEIVTNLLNVNDVHKADTFLKLGGHSLRAVVFCSRIRDAMGVSIPISQVYRLGSIERIAKWIDEQRESSSSSELDHDRHICPLIPVEQGNCTPLSLSQQRIWMLDQLHPNDPSYNITVGLNYQGSLDRDNFDQAWKMLCTRQRVLSSRVQVIDDQPWQVVEDLYLPVVRWIDHRERSHDHTDQVVSRESMLVFNLESDSLVRCAVILESTQATVVITIHHIIADAWSCAIIAEELGELYLSCIEHRDSTLKPLPISYADFAVWQRQLPSTTPYQHDLAYWKSQLQDSQTVELPLDSLRDSTPSIKGQRVNACLSESQTKQVREGAARAGVTPFAYMLAIFQVWIHRVTGSNDITVGTPIANREWTEIEGLVGFFMETAAIRTKLSHRDQLGDVIEQVSQTALDGFDHRDVPFQHIVDAVSEHTSTGMNPLFEIFFNHIAIDVRSGNESAPFQFHENEIDNATAKFDLTCYVFDESESETIEVVFNYRSDLFKQQTVERFLSQFTELLTNAQAHLQTTLSQLPITTHDKVFGAQDSANQVEHGLPESGLIHEFVKRQVDINPNRIAAAWVDGSLTYQQLWDRSTHIVSQLMTEGIHRGDRLLVGHQDPGELASSILSVLRIGCVYIPLDPYWPDHRIRQIIKSVDPVHAIVDQKMNDRLESIGFTGIRVTPKPANMLADQVPTLDESEQIGPVEIDHHSPAYMLFTSGSTGSPKGVAQSHQGVVSHMHAFADSLKLTNQDRILQVSSPAFDAAIMDMFSAWFTGAAWYYCDIQISDQHELAKFIESNEITIYHSAPSVFRWFTSMYDDAIDFELDSVRAIALGGEPVVRNDIDKVADVFPQCQLLINGMGMTESSLTLQLRIHPDECSWYSRWIPVGYAAKGSRVRLVDPDGNPTALFGEIEIESNRIALGYWVPETQSVTPIGEPTSSNTRRFRTGDLGYTLEDGSIVHMGRKDQQVQVHGCRVELSEVITQIKSIAGVADAFVIAQPNELRDRQLTGYIVLESGSTLTSENLQVMMGNILPGYMVPTTLVRVDHIPRVGGGKVDRRQLSALKQLQFTNTPTIPCVSESAMLRAVCSAFSQVLGEPDIGPYDNFFQHGGNSLKAIRVFSALRKSIGTQLPISVIYRAPTPLLLTQAIESFAVKIAPVHTFIALSKSGNQEPVYLLPGVGGHPLGFGPLVHLLNPNRPYIGVQLPDVNKVNELGRSLTSIASWIIAQMHLDELRVAPNLIGYSFGGALAMEIAIQLEQRGFSPATLILLDAHLPFGLPKKNKLGLINTHMRQWMQTEGSGRVDYIRQRWPRQSRQAPPALQHSQPSTEQELEEFTALARLNRRMLGEYIPSALYTGPVSLVRALQPDWLRFHKDDHFNGWSHAADPAQITISPIHASHLELFKAGHVEKLAQIVNASIASDQIKSIDSPA